MTIFSLNRLIKSYLRQAREDLNTFQKDGNIALLQQVASRMMWILGKWFLPVEAIMLILVINNAFPSHGGCYYILGFILFVLNNLESALILLEMSRTADPFFEPVDGDTDFFD